MPHFIVPGTTCQEEIWANLLFILKVETDLCLAQYGREMEMAQANGLTLK